MAHRTRVVWDEALTGYDFGPAHPMSPVRLDLTVRLAEALGLLAAPGVEVVAAPVPDSDELVLSAHDAGYVAAVRRASADPRAAERLRGLGTDDDPAFAGMHEASSRVLAATVSCAEAVWEGAGASGGASGADHAVNISGGLHHAMRGSASGFCIYNDAVAAITRLLALGAQRVAYVDVDVHHGDGVQAAFWDDPRVLTVSLHEAPTTLFPGTGQAGDVGGPGALGAAVNVALPAGTGDAGWLRALHAVVPPLLRAFAPDVLVSQHGCDTHALDPLGHLRLSVEGQLATTHLLHDLAHEVAGGRWVATGGGGYEVVQVVPRSWSHLIAVAAHAPVDAAAAVPAAWRRDTERRTGRRAPVLMGDRDAGSPAGELGAAAGDDRGGVDAGVERGVDAAVAATRAAAFPWHGLDPEAGPGAGAAAGAGAGAGAGPGASRA